MTFSVHLSTVFADLPLLERPTAARAAGFDAVESWWPGTQAHALINQIRRARLELTLVNADCGDIGAGERGFLNIANERERVLSAIDDAVALRPRYVNVLVGRGSGLDHVVQVLREVLDTMSRASAADVTGCGVTLLVEHLNERDVPEYLLPTPSAAALLVEEIGHPQLRLLYDTYHAQMARRDPLKDIPTFKDMIGHIHYSEAPDRHVSAPNLQRIVATLASVGYEGRVGLEYIPHEQTHRELAPFLVAM